MSLLSPTVRVVLIGPPGAGKTITGRLLGQRLKRPVVDADDDINEKFWGQTVASKLKELGDTKFVEAEGQALLSFPSDRTDCVVSLSGSNPLHPAAMEHVSKNSIVVYLDAPLDAIVDRMHAMKVDRIVGQASGTPLKDILLYRRNFYENCYGKRVIISEGETPESIVDQIMASITNDQNYRSTRGWEPQHNESSEFLEIVKKGLAPDRGLFVAPSILPFTPSQLLRMVDLSYQERALWVLERFPLGSGLPPPALAACIQRAYETFEHPSVLPVTHLEANLFLMEMFHGPTASFKDLSLQLTPKLLTRALQQSNKARNLDTQENVGLLVATSGDTGTAALDGFCREDNVPVVVLFPQDGVSSLQKLQMVTAPASTLVMGIEADFDYCQTTVKDILEKQKSLLGGAKVTLSSANSINFGRFLPQVVFTISSYLELVKTSRISFGDKVHVSVPTGNFGNILGCLVAKRLGLPLANIVCASNSNNILTDFIRTGVYSIKGREFHRTISPSIDILISSNIERYIYILAVEDGLSHEEAGHLVNTLFAQLHTEQSFTLPQPLLKRLQSELSCGWCSETECKETIRLTKERTGTLVDPHTAVALRVAEQLGLKKSNGVPVLVASTASYAKFPEAMREALGGTGEVKGMWGGLEDERNPVPVSLSSLFKKEVNHKLVLPANAELILEHVKDYLNRFENTRTRE